MQLKCANRFFLSIIHIKWTNVKPVGQITAALFFIVIVLGFFDVLRIKVYKNKAIKTDGKLGNLGSNYSLPEIKRSN